MHSLHRDGPSPAFGRENKRVLLWGAGVPAVAAVLAVPTLGASLGLFGLYAVQAARIAKATRDKGFDLEHSLAWGVSCALCKFPESVGLAAFHFDRFRGRTPKIIEHKRPSQAPASAAPPSGLAARLASRIRGR